MSFAKHFKSRVLLRENPEFVADHYPRDNYGFQFFLGDENGALITKITFNEPRLFTSHSDILRYLKEKEYLDKKTYELFEVKDSKFETVGNPATIDMNYSGIILPKQKDVDGTYISFWTERSFKRMKIFLLDYAEQHYDGPFYYEYTDLDDPNERSSVVPARKRVR